MRKYIITFNDTFTDHQSVEVPINETHRPADGMVVLAEHPPTMEELQMQIVVFNLEHDEKTTTSLLEARQALLAGKLLRQGEIFIDFIGAHLALRHVRENNKG